MQQLTQKETGLLKDLKGQEDLCVKKYSKHASAAADPQLKKLFTDIAGVERGHLESIAKIEQGQVPSVSGSSPSIQSTFTQAYSGGSADTQKQNDAYLCSDLLAIEKHASHLYDTCIFEFADGGVRQVLNHIQKEEQEHGKAIYDYMKTNGMYS